MVGTVVTKSTRRQFSTTKGDRNDLKIIRDWLRNLQPEFSERKEDLWRVLIPNRIWEFDGRPIREAEDQDKTGWDALTFEDETSLNRGNETGDNYVNSAWYISENRYLFTSSDGRVGLGSSHMQPGDKVVVLLGADLPLILRHQKENQYRLIEAAYVHGIMKGEMLERDPHIERICIG